MLRFGRIPRKGERWKGRFADFVIEDAAPTAIRKVRMILPAAPEKREQVMSPTRTVTLIRGDGIGPEVADAVVSILEAAGAPLSFEEVVVGREAEKRDGDPLPPSALDAIRKTGLALKGPVGTPIGKGFQSVNVRLRQTLELYANLRPVKNVPSVESRFQGVDLVIVRENTEDLYSGLEHIVVPGVVESLKIITEAASTRIARFAFEYARRQRPAPRHGRPQGEHHEALRRALSRLLPQGGRGLPRHRRRRPHRRRAVHAPGDAARDPRRAAAREPLRRHRVGPRAPDSSEASASCPAPTSATKAAIFEAVHGTAPDIAGQDKANPTALLMSAILMLRHLDLAELADRVEAAMLGTLRAGIKTPDLGGRAGTKEFAKEIAARL